MRPWWDSALTQQYDASGIAVAIIANHVLFSRPTAYANDRDHCPW
jgi:hypothetical protein